MKSHSQIIEGEDAKDCDICGAAFSAYLDACPCCGLDTLEAQKERVGFDLPTEDHGFRLVRPNGTPEETKHRFEHGTWDLNDLAVERAEPNSELKAIRLNGYEYSLKQNIMVPVYKDSEQDEMEKSRELEALGMEPIKSFPRMFIEQLLVWTLILGLVVLSAFLGMAFFGGI